MHRPGFAICSHHTGSVRPRSIANRLRKSISSLAAGKNGYQFASKLEDTRFIDLCDQVDSWVIFSDLHVSLRTLPVCIKVLQEVECEAKRRGAGVLMLGDFWHERGVLRVDALNRVLSIIRPWKMPMLMICGNHDQVDMHGWSHSLASLAAGCPNVHVFDEPSSFKNAVFLPYRRNPEALRSSLNELVHDETKALFIHADVVGATMNGAIIAKAGIHPNAFPSGLPVFSGHYHKPHMVKESEIQYVGSPFQVTRSERGQQKHLVVLNKEWQEIEKVPIDIGPRHFLVEGVDPELPADLREGDRLQWHIQAEDRHKIKELKNSMSEKGVLVEISVKPTMKQPRIKEAETLSASEQFCEYAKHVKMSHAAKEKGLLILKDISSQSSVKRADPTSLELTLLEMEGFGPFLNLVEYPLQCRGARVVCGENSDDSFCQSNGAGKSLLVVAPLWAITGKISVRGEVNAKLTQADLVHDRAARARVKICGNVNGEPFVIERIVGKKRGTRGSLTFSINDIDLTKADMRHTQAEIDEKLNSNLLTSCAFYGHGNVTELLNANDTAFKAELGKIVDLDTWGCARDVSYGMLKDQTVKLEESQSHQRHCQMNLHASKEKLESARETEEVWEGVRQVELMGLNKELAGHTRELLSVVKEANGLRSCIGGWKDWALSQQYSSMLQGASAQVETSEVEESDGEGEIQEEAVHEEVAPMESGSEEISEDIRERDARLKRLAAMRSRIQNLVSELEKLKLDREEAQKKIFEKKGFYKAKVDRLEAYMAIEASDKYGDNMMCSLCLQPVDSTVHKRNSKQLREEVEQAKAYVNDAQSQDMMLSMAIELKEQMIATQESAWKESESLQNLLREKKPPLQLKKTRKAKALRAEKEGEQRKREEKAAMVLMDIVSSAEVAISKLDGHIKKLSAETKELTTTNRQEAGGDFVQSFNSVEEGMKAIHSHLEKVPEAVRQMDMIDEAVTKCKQKIHFSEKEQNPVEILRQSMQRAVGEAEEELKGADSLVQHCEGEVKVVTELDKSFKSDGVSSFVLEGVLGDLKTHTDQFLDILMNGIDLVFNCAKRNSAEETSAEVIQKEFFLQNADGRQSRSLQQFSSGEVRRIALALTLGFSTLLAERGRVNCNLLVFDEALGQLDKEGCEQMVQIVSELPQDTILLVGQAESFVTEAFDVVDIVKKKDGISRIVLHRD